MAVLYWLQVETKAGISEKLCILLQRYGFTLLFALHRTDR